MSRTRRSNRHPAAKLLSIEGLEQRLLYAFGVTTGTAPTGQPTYVIDNGGDLKFSIIKGGSISNTLHLGDVSSIQFKNKEMLATYAVTGRYSHYEQGLSSSDVISYTVDNTNGWILVTCDDSADTTYYPLIHYYAVRRNDNNIYMASLPLDMNHLGAGEGRFIAYLDRNVFSNPEAPSDNNGTSGAIEGSDVFGHPDGTTTSKFYNMGRRMIENVYHGVTGNAGGVNVGAWMFMGNREHSAGGPFFKDIDFQSGSAVEIYNCLFTGHTQTEPYRAGLQGPYAFQFTDGSAPTAPDYSWMEALNLQGWIAASQRGALTGMATGVPAGHEVTVALANATAQYWGTPDAAGKYTVTGVQPGTYTETLYDNELAVGTRSVTISAGVTTAADITDTYYYVAAPTWRIGTWDGTPVGFLNSDKIEIMHPSDVRMTSWTSTPNFVVGTNTDDQWPLVQFMGVNNSQRITFNLTSAQAAVAQTLRIGITLGFEGGRNRITVNSGKSYAWTSAIPSASTDLNSRGITRGTWRGPNQLYTYNIPTTALHEGTNTIDLPVVSGSYVAGQTWLSPNVVYDAIDLVPTSTITNTPVVSSITVTPAPANVATGKTRQFTAVAKDQFGNVTPANVIWSTSNGTIDNTGLFTAPGTTGSATITATGGAINGSATVNIVTGSTPTVATAANATPNPVTGTTTSLSVLGADDGGEAALAYTWFAIGPAAVGYSANGTNAAKNTTATFTKAGTYTFTATISDAGGLVTTSSVVVTVNQVLTSVAISPTSTTVAPNATQQFAATAKDQFASAMLTQPAFTWSVISGGGSVNASGLYTAGATAGSANVRATTGGFSATASVAVVVPRAWWKLDETSGTAVADSSGNASNATAVNNPAWVTGKFGDALSFDGVNDEVDLPNSIANSAAGSIAMWVKTGANFADSAMLFYTSPVSTGNGGGAEQELHLNFTSTEQIQFFIEGGSTDVSLTSASSYADNAWHHVAATWDINGNAALYIDGALIASQAHDAQNFSGSARTYLGRPGAAQRYYSGLMDDVRLFNAAISATQVQALFNEVPPGTITGQAYHDKNGDGVFNAGDVGISGATVFIDADNDGLLDGGETSTLTDGSGNYSFGNLPAGTYTVREIAPSDFAVATASNTASVSGGPSANNNFANARIVYNGTAGAADNYLLRKNANGRYEILIGGTLAYTVFAAVPSLAFNLAGGGDSLTIDSTNGTPIPSGGVSFDGGSGASGTLIVNAAAGADAATFGSSSVTLNGATVNEANVASVRFDGDGGWDDVAINGGPSVTFPDAQQLNSLTLSGSASALLAAGGAANMITRGLSIAPTARLDLADNDLAIDYSGATPLGTFNGSAYTGVTGLLASGFAGGDWSGGGIVTSMSIAVAPNSLTTLAVAEASDVLGIGAGETALWDGQTVDGTTVLVKYTYAGDANLDGTITGDDYFQIDSAFPANSSGYFNGDFNFDGVITGDDYFLIDSNFPAQGPAL